jgi:hypothetical protein
VTKTAGTVCLPNWKRAGLMKEDWQIT